MKRSTERILTTHTGSLPRPDDLVAMLYAKESGKAVDETAFRSRVGEVVRDIVRRQLDCGVDVVNDGEAGKVGYSTYVIDRLTGFGGEGGVPPLGDLVDFPEYAKRLLGEQALAEMKAPACDGPVAWKDRESVTREIDDFRAALEGVAPAEAFMSAASPGVISLFLRNGHYPSHEAYLAALAEVMREEYEAIANAGFVLQIDCPDLAMGRHIQFTDASLEEFRRMAALHVEALNHAVANIPADRMRIHLCWGNYEGPHHRDVPLADVIDVILRAKPHGLSFESANPRHEHEWTVFEETKLPDGKVLIPGMLDSCSNYVEHPELVAQRLVRFARIVGRENVLAGTDCGFATFAGFLTVEPNVTWAKFRAMAEGARLASERLW
jgi:5-methyltetrahydropteroyltriglutamate--homocysteine methyltransferase